MGAGLFDLIAQGCQSLAATAAPSITAIGIHIVIALATMMIVWFACHHPCQLSRKGASPLCKPCAAKPLSGDLRGHRS